MPTLRQFVSTSFGKGKEDIDWIRHQPDEAGNDFLSVGRTNGSYLIRYAGIADYQIDLSSETVHWELATPLHKNQKDSAIHLAKNQVLPMMLSTKRLLVLHASSILLESGDAIAFSGPSTIGKSTIAKAFQDQDSGTLLADDWISIRQRETTPRLYGYSDEVEDKLAGHPPIGKSNKPHPPARSHQFCVSDLIPFKTQSPPPSKTHLYLGERRREQQNHHRATSSKITICITGSKPIQIRPKRSRSTTKRTCPPLKFTNENPHLYTPLPSKPRTTSRPNQKTPFNRILLI